MTGNVVTKSAPTAKAIVVSGPSMVSRRWTSTHGGSRRISRRSNRLTAVRIKAATVPRAPISAAAIHRTLVV